MPAPYIYDEFFASGRAETVSPFLTEKSRHWAKNLPLKSALVSAFFLALAFSFSFINTNLSYLCLSSVYLLVGTPALLDALEDLRNLEINIDVLMTLAALLSVVIGSGMEGALLLVLFELSAAMENAVEYKTKSALLGLRQIAPKMAVVVENGIYYDRALQEIGVGALIFVKAGEVVPLDGIVIAGNSDVNLVHLTGESALIPKRPGDDVPAGARNMEGSLTIQVNRTSRDSTLSRIIQLITEASEAKPQVERILDRFGKYYSITIILLSAFFALTIPLLFDMPYLGKEGGIYRALTFLIAASPCALIIATPTAYLSAISSCARKGILLKGGAILDGISSCSQIAFDKTGTLTTGLLRCQKVESLFKGGELPTETAVAVAAGLEQGAVHPVASAICNYATQQKIAPIIPDDFRAIPGFGVQGSVTISGKKYDAFIGHAEYIKDRLPEELKKPFQSWKTESVSTLMLLGQSLYLFSFQDEIRPEAQKLMDLLKNETTFTLSMLTGDHLYNAEVVANTLQIKNIHANLRPDEKLEKVAEMAKSGGLIMVGDGINDAPALKRATVGVSMGKVGSATAVDASDVVILHDDLVLISWLIRKARKTMAVVRENLILALGVILLATTPALLGWVPLWIAVILHEGGTVIVGLNSLRLLKR